ncbi:hypothetical protein FRC08_008773 [Ceratobasidium sp. 394]|nr:hypothetical protein FRC08_008773 [Ceratobasidium sp. 394]KAG9090615.1 hypothetical protein FS749_000419 [Ceratobasidium sp. UAMH 11750]
MPNNSVTSWYNSQYRVWDRTRRLQMAPFLAQAERNVPGAAPAAPPGAVAIDMSNVKPADKESHSESLFGPPIPADAATLDAHPHSTQPRDQVSQAVVDGWVEKNKQGHEPATTLQALVNLKRPSLRLTPLASNASNTDLVSTSTKASHGLEFEYDCDAAKCHITVVMSPTSSSIFSSQSGAEKPEPMVVFDGVTDGGFGRALKHEHGAILDLVHHDDTKEADTSAVEGAPVPEPTLTVPEPAVQRSRRRISVPFHIHRRSRGPQQAVGPALPVVDADAQPPVAEGSSKDHAPKEAGGVHVSINLEALDEAGKPYTNRNSQMTLLHIVKTGQPPTNGAEDTRSWIVRVLRREATIGTHTFRLHEIYGLANTNAPSHPPAPSYPPAPTTDTDGEALPDAHAQQQTYEFAGAECVLCLSSPREVVLLPCRHLVACKECADNMITFGAGEGVSAPAESNAEATGANETNGTNGTGTAPGPNNPAPEPLSPFQAAAAAGRRKRKAKGWFCPVCRQPYTSMLRISMQPLNVKPDDTPSTETASPAANEQDPQVQSKGPLGGVVSIARDMLGRKSATESPVEANTGAPGQSTTNNTTPNNA